MISCYVDTSALAKWYLPEAGSTEFGMFIQAVPEAIGGRLILVELRCLLARRRREGLIDAAMEGQVYTSFLRDVAAGYIEIRSMPDTLHAVAVELIDRLPGAALRSLDALHLAAAMESNADGLATGDHRIAQAGGRLGFEIAFFGNDA